jgi:hypothetical protein
LLRANSGTLSQVGGKASDTISRPRERALRRCREGFGRWALFERAKQWSVGEPFVRERRRAVLATDGVYEPELAGA